MLKVTNGVVTATVTRGAFESYFKHAGFSIVNETRAPEKDGVDNYHPSLASDEDGEITQEEEDEETYTEEYLNEPDEAEEPEEPEEKIIDYSEIPLSELGFDELVKYADQLGIDHKGIRSKKELRAAIREYLKRK